MHSIISMMICCSQGVESDQCDAFRRSYEKKELVTVDVKSTLADGLAVSTMGLRSFNTALPNVDRVVTVRYGIAVTLAMEYTKCSI